MRHAWQVVAIVATVSVWSFANAKAEEARSRWWPFGANSADAAAPSPGTSTAMQGLPSSGGAAAAVPATSESPMPSIAGPSRGAASTGMPLEEEPSWMIRSPFARVSWPRIQLPEVHLPRPRLWPQKAEVDDVRNAWVGQEDEPARPSPLQAAKQGAHRVAESTRSAWRKTVDFLTPDMFAAEEPPPAGPRTVTEWMAQDRLDP